MAFDLGDDRQRRLRLQAVALAIVGLTLLVALAWFVKAPAIEDDLEDRTAARLRINVEADDTWALAVDQLVIVANGRNVAVRGPVDSLTDVERIRTLIEPLYGVRRLDTDGLQVRPVPQRDIYLVGEVRAEQVTIEGELSTADQREQLLLRLVDTYGPLDPEPIAISEIEPLRGDDDTRLAGFALLAERLSGPDTVAASIAIDEGVLTVTAVVRSERQRLAVVDAAEQFDARASVTAVGIDVDQVDLEIVVEPSLVLISGQVLTPEQRLQLLRTADGAVGPAGVEADIIVAERPAAFEGADARVILALDLLQQLAGANITDAIISVADGVVAVRVSANSIDAASELRRTLPAEGVDLVVEVAADPVLAVDDQVVALDAELASVEAALSSANEFATGSDQLTPAARQELRLAVPILARHPEPVVRVVVHTDTRGGETSNQSLSQRRADQVAAFLIDLGVAPSRVVAVGAGESQPLVEPETDDADYARNRRIEFEVIAR